MTQELVQGVIGLPANEFEAEFRRVYSDLYPNEHVLRQAIKHYKKEHPYLEIAPVDADSSPRIKYVNLFLNASTSEDYQQLMSMRSPDSYFTFRDMKEIVWERTVDIMHLSKGVSIVPSTLFPETLEVNVGKCITAMRKNNISIGNFGSVIWQRGSDYLDAVESGLLEWQNEPFAVARDKPTYGRPVLVVSNVVDQGVMLGNYVGFLRQKGIGVVSDRERPRIPGFSFVSKNYMASRDGIGFCLDTLDYF